MARRKESAVLGLFREPAEVARAIGELRALGFRGPRVEILSAVPYPEGAFGEEPVRHRIYTFTIVGALCGLAVGILLTIATQLSYPLVTYGMPILALPPMINVVFEGTMLGALLFTVGGVLFESRLPDLGRTPHDPRISQGYLGVLVRAGDRVALAEQVLRGAGAVDLVGGGAR